MIGFHTNGRVADTLDETLSRIKAAGFEYVMLDTKLAELEVAIKLAIKIGLKVHSVHLPYRQPYGHNVDNLWRSGEKNDIIVNDLIGQIKTCGKYGVGVVILHPSTRDGTLDISQGIKSLQKILAATKASGVKIAVENLHPLENKYLRALLDNIDDPRLGFCYDCGHHYLYAPEENLIGKYANRCFAIHLHDNLMDSKGGQSSFDIHLLPFDGKIDFEKVCRDLARSKYNGPIMIESKYNRGDAGIYCYNDKSPTEFLAEAYNRGKKLAKMLDTEKSNL